MLVSASLCLAAALGIEFSVEEPIPIRIAADARLSFAAADHDLMSDLEPAFNIGLLTASPQRLFFDDHDALDLGYQKNPQLGLRFELPETFYGVSAELALRVDLRLNMSSGVVDRGSYLKLIRPTAVGDFILILFPFDSDSIRLGYSRALTWGTEQIFPNGRMTPGFRLGFARPDSYAFAALKTTYGLARRPDLSLEDSTFWGVLGGAGWEPLSGLRLEAGGGYFNRGTINKPELLVPGRGVETFVAYGFSTRVTVAHGLPTAMPIDFRHFDRDPYRVDRLFEPVTAVSGFAIEASSELSLLVQNLQDTDLPSQTELQFATATDAQVTLRFDTFIARLLFVRRDLEFILFNVPSHTPFVAFPAGISTEPEYAGAVELEYGIPSLELTPWISAGLRYPAHVVAVDFQGIGVQTFVYRSEHDVQILDPGDEVQLTFEAKAAARILLHPLVAVALEIVWTHDPNLRKRGDTPFGMTYLFPAEPNRVGFNFMVRGRI